MDYYSYQYGSPPSGYRTVVSPCRETLRLNSENVIKLGLFCIDVKEEAFVIAFMGFTHSDCFPCHSYCFARHFALVLLGYSTAS